MLSKEIISKSLDEAILKCSPSSKIRSLGASVKTSTYTNENGMEVEVYSYENGVQIQIENREVLIEEKWSDVKHYETIEMFSKVIVNGKEYELSYGDSDNDNKTDEFFNYQKEYIIENYGRDGWEFYCQYANEFGTSQGWHLNDILRGVKSKSDVTDIDGDFYISDFLLDNHDRFVEMERNLPLDVEDNITLRLASDLHRNDSIGKKIVSDKGHTSSSTIGQISNYDLYGDPDNSWFIFTVHEKGSGVHGGYLGEAIKEADGYDFEREVNYPPNQKFERILMDEKNKFIIQVPVE